jgi:hypothetical protein
MDIFFGCYYWKTFCFSFPEFTLQGLETTAAVFQQLKTDSATGRTANPTLWSRVHIEKQIFVQLVKEFASFHVPRSFVVLLYSQYVATHVSFEPDEFNVQLQKLRTV